MNALDGLQAKRHKVGDISHVQEMTERIATRILLHRTVGDGVWLGCGDGIFLD